MARVFILLLDSFGIGASEDAPRFGDAGANTFGSIANACALGSCDKEGMRKGSLQIPSLISKGLHRAAIASTGMSCESLEDPDLINAHFGYAVEKSVGKDTPSGHFEIVGQPILTKWHHFPKTTPCFEQALIDEFCKRAKIPGVLGNCHAAGVQIMKTLGQSHIDSLKPIVYTSADSVFQIAAHEAHFGLERLYEICLIARELLEDYPVGRVIARPFIGEHGQFERTANRKDYGLLPAGTTLLDNVQQAGGKVYAVGKVSDIFSGQGITESIKADGNDAIFDVVFELSKIAPEKSLIFANFVDFDSKYGHQRDITGYASALEVFDKRLGVFESQLEEDDMVIITADHGCDPTFPGTDHTREHIPVLVFGPTIKQQFIGKRETFADIGQSAAAFLKVEPLESGVSFLS